MNLRETGLAKHYYALLERFILPLLIRKSWSPDRMTLLGMVLSLLVPLGFWLHPLAGAFALGVSGICDSLDGLLARHTDRKGRFGAFLDSTADRVSDFFYLTGFWILFRKTGTAVPAATFLVFFGFLLTVLVSYTKARIEGLGGDCQVGWFGREMRTLFLLVWALLSALLPELFTEILWGGLAFYLIASAATVIIRIRHAQAAFHGKRRPSLK